MKKYAYAILFLFFSPTIFSQQIPYTNCDDCWNPDSLGNHRVVLEFNGTGKVAKATIEWRRRDENPELKRIIVEDAATHQKIWNVKTGEINRVSGEIYFEPISGKGIYYVYYMPYKNEGSSNYPKGNYLPPENTTDTGWLEMLHWNNISVATVKEIQSINAFNSFYPMEIIATPDETMRLVNDNTKKDFLIFPEDRLHSIRMKNDFPQWWIDKGLQDIFRDTVLQGENFSYQLGVFALKDVRNIQLHFSDLKNEDGQIISSKNMSCLNTEGTDYTGKPMQKIIDIEKEKLQPFWCLVDIPQNAKPGKYIGKVTVTSADNSFATDVKIELLVKNEVAKNHGVNKPWKMTRLEWLNSTLAQENTVIAPYTPLEISGNTISLLGRKMILGNDGLPKQIQTFFTQEMTGYQLQPNNILSDAIQFHFTKKSAATEIVMKNEGVKFTLRQPGTVQWTATNSSDDLKMEVKGSLEFDGFVAYTIQLTALNDIDLENISMQIPFEKQAAKYMMGLGLKGEKRPENFTWKWDVAHKNQDGAWIGNVNEGLQYSLRDEQYVRPLNTNFYLLKPLLLPKSWGNETLGG
ncbi:MAG: glycoside hydrolase domain-containing protein, partial [Chitinophagaceae bacterium]